MSSRRHIITGKNAKNRIGPGRMDTAHIHEIMGETPVYPQGGRGTSDSDIIHSTRKSDSIQSSVYREEYLHGIAGIQRWSLHIPAVLYRKLFILAGVPRDGKVTLGGFINHLASRHLEEYRKMMDVILEGFLPGQL